MKMLRRLCGVTEVAGANNENNRIILIVTEVSKEVQKKRLLWYERRYEHYIARRVMHAVVSGRGTERDRGEDVSIICDKT